MHGHDSDDEELPVAALEGNWGHKNFKGGRWVRRGKITPWGPEMEDWEVRALVYAFYSSLNMFLGR